MFELYKSLNSFMAYFSTEMKILWDQTVLDKHLRLLRTASGFIALSISGTLTLVLSCLASALKPENRLTF